MLMYFTDIDVICRFLVLEINLCIFSLVAQEFYYIVLRFGSLESSKYLIPSALNEVLILI